MSEIVEKTDTVVTEDTAELATVPEADAAEIQPEGGKRRRKSKRKKKKDEFEYEKDIRYRGPLSYRHLKLLGWICIVLAQIAVVEGLKLKVCGTANEFFLNDTVMDLIGPSALPLLLISVFAFLLKKRDNYKTTIIVYGSLALAISALFVLIYEHYILGIADTLLKGDRSDLAARLDELLYSSDDYNGFIAFNIFIDVFLCALIMFFLDYEPKKFFTGKKILLFRALVVLPLAYEVACVILKIMATDALIRLPLWISPFLTTKPPVSILMFVSIVRYIKLREERFFAAGRTREQYEAFIDTNINSLRFSLHLMLIIVVYALLDIGLLILLSAVHLVIMVRATTTSEITPEMLTLALESVSEWGFGGTARMLDLLPIVLLFSYTRSHKQPLFDTAIPVAGVIAIVIVYIDGAFSMVQGAFARFEDFVTPILLSANE